MQPNIEGNDTKERASEPVSPAEVPVNTPDTPQEAFELSLADDPTPEHVKSAYDAMDSEGMVVVEGVRMPYSEAVERLKREGEGKTTNEGAESTAEPSSAGTNSESQAEQFRSAMQSLRETYEQQLDAVSNAIQRFDEAKQQHGPDDPRTLSAKNQWDFADRARAETGEAIASYIQQYPEIADVFEVTKGEDQAESAQEVSDTVSESSNSIIEDAAKDVIEDIVEDVIAEVVDPVEETPKRDEKTAEQGEEIPIEERLEAPKTEMFEKYGQTMRQSADKLVEVVTQMNGKWDELVAAGGADKRPDLWEEWQALNDGRNKLKSSINIGAGVLKYPERKTNESWQEDENRKHKLREEFEQTTKSDPYTIMRLAEAGQLDFRATQDENAKFASTSLRSNTEFMSQLLDSLPDERWSGEHFWSQVTGEAAKDRDLYLRSIKKHPSSYQYGSKEWKNDPEIQKIALESGLDPSYLGR